MIPGSPTSHRLLCLALLILGLTITAFAGDSKHAALDGMLRDLHARDLFHGAIVVSEGGKVVYEAGFGLANREASIEFTPDTPNDAASVAKTLTAATVWMLKETGRLNLDDEVQRHLPTFPYPGITVRHLLTHSSGLPDYDYFEKTWVPGTVWSNELILATLAELRPELTFEPGSEFAYCNAGYDLVALVVGVVSEMTFEAFARRHILAPLRMDTGFVRPAMFADWPHPRTKGYRLRDGTWEPHDASDAEGVVGGANLQLSARDLHRWNTSFLESPLLSPTSIAEGMRPAVLGGSVSGLNLLSWNQSADGSEVWYAGEHRAFSTRVYRDHAKRRSIVFTSNNTPPQWLIPALIRAIKATLDGVPPEPLVAPTVKPMPRAARDMVSGTYALRHGPVVLVVIEGNFFMTPEGGVRCRAFAVGDGIFYVPGHDTWFWFTPELDLVASRLTGIERITSNRHGSTPSGTPAGGNDIKNLTTP